MINSITFTHRNALQCNATGERIFADARHAVRNDNRGQGFATGERRAADACDAVSDRY